MQLPWRIYRLLNILSIDVALGAMISALWFEKILRSELRPYAVVSLGLTVWIIYTADHLSDARRLKTVASTERHRFHQQHFTLLVVLIMFAVLAVMTLTLFIDRSVLYGGVYLSGIVILYLVIQSRLRVFKEPAGAALYCAGVLVPSLPISDQTLTPYALLLILHFLTVVLTNLVLFSWCDYHHDKKDNRSSVVTAVGHRSGKILLLLLFVLQVISSGILLHTATSLLPFAVVTGMSGVLLVIFFNHAWFSLGDRYRYAGDAIFFLPLICLAIP